MTSSTSASDFDSADTAVDQMLYDDAGDPIGTREFCVAEGLAASATDRLSRAFARLTPDEIAAALSNRVAIEQAKGMLMFIYGVDEHDAFEQLKWRAQESNVKLRVLAERLVDDLANMARDQDVSLRTACNALMGSEPTA